MKKGFSLNDMRHLATIEKIKTIVDIPNADKIECATIKDWKVVIEKDRYKIDELVIYFEIDSLLPVDNLAFDFLAKASKPKNAIIDDKEQIGYGYRVRTIKLRGQISQGLILPISLFPDIANKIKTDSTLYKVGTDVTEELGIVKYEKPIPANLAGVIKGSFPNFIPKTDEERVQNLGDVVNNIQGESFYISEKLDGSSVTIYKKDNILGVCSRNLELLDTPENTLWEIARKYNLSEILPDGYSIQGEIMGEDIQKNPLLLKGHELFIYNVFDIQNHSYLNYNDFINFCVRHDLKPVPIVNDTFTLNTNVDGLLELADDNSLLNTKVKREGIVIRPLIEKTVEINGILRRLSFKAISNKYLLKHE